MTTARRRLLLLSLLLVGATIVGWTQLRLRESSAEHPLQPSPFCASTPPKIAWCVAGAARTLSRPAVARSIRTNLFDAFGARSTDSSQCVLPVSPCLTLYVSEYLCVATYSIFSPEQVLCLRC